MKPCLIILVLLCSTAVADNRFRPPVRPYRMACFMPWTRIPYPNCPFETTFRNGQTYEVRNPLGFACEPWYDSNHYFHCHLTIDLDTATIDSASYEGEIFKPKVH